MTAAYNIGRCTSLVKKPGFEKT